MMIRASDEKAEEIEPLPETDELNLLQIKAAMLTHCMIMRRIPPNSPQNLALHTVLEISP